MHVRKITMIVTTVLMLTAGTTSAATLTSAFDTGADGWTGNPGQGALTYVAAGGNPGGHIRIQDVGAGSANGFASGALAGSAWLGNLSAFDGGTFSIDLATFTGVGGTFPSFGRIILFNGPTDTASPITTDIAVSAPSNGAGWQTYATTFDAASFGVSQSDWLDVLTNVTLFGFSTDAFDGADTIGIDTVTLTAPVSAVPLPAGLVLLLSGLAAMGLWRRRL